MEPRPVSVIVVSRHRPLALQRCLLSLRQQDHALMEVVVVADPLAAAQTEQSFAAAGLPVRVEAFDEANISMARNLGLAKARGEIVAFIDDDAVAEPTWLSRLTAPFDTASVVAATGFVRGRNGISYQWRACEVDLLGQDHPIDSPETAVRQGDLRRAVKVQGTNCAFRRAALVEIGGFDPAIRFYLDDADVSLRIAAIGPTAIVPGAEVLHGFAASAMRRSDRVPLSLYEIAASTAVFLRRHAEGADLTAAWLRLEQAQGARVAGHRKAGRLSAGEAVDLLASLTEGWRDGLTRQLGSLTPLADVDDGDFLPLPHGGARPGCVIAGRIWQKARLFAEARRKVAEGRITTVICLSPTARAHRVELQNDGFWLQTGGLFGRSQRSGPRVRLIGFSRKLAEEVRRIAQSRPVD